MTDEEGGEKRLNVLLNWNCVVESIISALIKDRANFERSVWSYAHHFFNISEKALWNKTWEFNFIKIIAFSHANISLNIYFTRNKQKIHIVKILWKNIFSMKAFFLEICK